MSDDPLVQAGDHRTSPERLRALADADERDVRTAVAANPNTPPGVLFELATEFPQTVVENAALPLLLLENPRLIADVPEKSLCAILELPEVPPEFLDQGARHRSWAVKQKVAAHPQTPGELLVKLARHYFFFEEVALNANTPRSYLEFLVEHPWTSIRVLMAKRERLDDDLVDVLADDEDEEVRRALAAREDLDEERRSELLADQP